MKRSLIRSTGRYLPPRLITNDYLSRFMDTTDEWIRQRTGIEQRYWIPEEGGMGASDLALEASRIALDRAGWKAEDLDMIIFATLSPDIFVPGSGCLLQAKLGLDTTPALDIRQQCTGFIYGLVTADSYIKTGVANRVLVVGAEVQSSGLDISTRGRDMAILFGDGAGVACVEGVETDQDIGILATALHAQGRYASSLMLEAPTSRYTERITSEMMAQGRHYPSMEGKSVFKHAVRRLPEVTQEVLEKAGLGLDDIDLIIPHQANLRINQFYQKTLGVPDEKMFHNIMRYGNTTAGSIPIAMDEAIELGRLDTQKDTLLLAALGAGLTWAGLVYRFGSEEK